MIKLSLDEAFCFDLLTIALVKSKKQNNIQNAQNYFALASEIKEQIGVELMQAILNSEEFSTMRDGNNKVFEAVDMVKDDSIPGSVIDKLNYQRFLNKQALQQKFFGGELKETKIGY